MAERRFDIIFDGSISDDHQIDEVKGNLQQLFKLDSATVDKLFSGKPVAIKKNLDRKEAQQYQAALSKAGAKIQLVLNRPNDTAEPNKPESNPSNTAKQTSPVESRANKTDRLPLEALPVGGHLLDEHEKPSVEPVTVSTDHLKTIQAPIFGAQDLEPPSANEGQANAINAKPYPVNSHITVNESITLADLNDESVYQGEKALDKTILSEIDIDHLSLSQLSELDNTDAADTAGEFESLELNIDFELLEAGEDLLQDSEKKYHEAADIDTSALSLSDSL